MQALAGNDRIEIGMLPQGTPVGLAEGRTALAAGLAFSALCGPATAEPLGGSRVGAGPLLGVAFGGDELAGNQGSGMGSSVAQIAIVVRQGWQQQKHGDCQQVAADCGPNCRKSEVVCQ